MKRVLCFVLIFIMAFSLTACASERSSQKEETPEDSNSWTPVTVYEDFGEVAGYSNTTIEFETRCVLISKNRQKSLPVTFRYTQNKEIQIFSIDGISINGFRYKIDENISESINVSRSSLHTELGYSISNTSMNSEDFSKIWDALKEGKDVAFCVVQTLGNQTEKYAFIVSGNGFKEAVDTYIEKE